jgi:very-short-patch-repair endonuclease
MGYSKGRKLTYEIIKAIAAQHKTRWAFKKADSSAHNKASKMGILDEVCSHMIQRVSEPQKICQYILESLLDKKSIYNDRKIIKPYELDLYFPILKLAVEYDGSWWHAKTLNMGKSHKEKKCKSIGIQLLTFKERSRFYENDIKNDIKTSLPTINNFCGTNFTPNEVDQIEVDYTQIYNSIADWPSILQNINSCNTLDEYKSKFPVEYGIVCRRKRRYLLQNLKRKEKHVITNDQILDIIKKTYTTYNTFTKTPYYHLCRKRNLLPTVKKIIPPCFTPMTDESIIQKVVSTYDKYDTFLNDSKLYKKCVNRKLLAKIKYYFGVHDKQFFAKMTDNEIVDFVKDNYKTYNSVTANATLYTLILNRNLCGTIKKHLNYIKLSNRRWNMSDDVFIRYALDNFNNYEKLYKQDKGYYIEASRRKLLKKIKMLHYTA